MKFFWNRDKDAGEERHSSFGASSFSASTFGASSMALLMVAPAPAIANEQAAKMTVSATVLKHASLKVLAQPASVVVTAADIARGYVDVPAPAQVAIRSNSARGYMLEFAAEAGFSRQIEVRGLNSPVQLGPAGGAVMQPHTGPGITRTTLELGFRFILADTARAGTYPWPMHLSVTPI
jgi:hypothetical protein